MQVYWWTTWFDLKEPDKSFAWRSGSRQYGDEARLLLLWWIWSSSKRNWVKYLNAADPQSDFWLAWIIITMCSFVGQRRTGFSVLRNSQNFYFFLSLGSLPLSPLACLVGDTMLLIWLHWHYWMRTDLSWVTLFLFFCRIAL